MLIFRLWITITRTRDFVIGAAVAFALALWWADLSATRWQSVCAVAFSPDGSTLAAGSYSGKGINENEHRCVGDIRQRVHLFGAGSGSMICALHDERHDGTWGSASVPRGPFLSFSPDGATLAVGTWDGTVMLWDPRIQRLAKVLRTQCPRIKAVSFSPDGRTLAAGFRGWFSLWDTTSYREARGIATGAFVSSISFSPDSEMVAIGDEIFHGAELWDVAAGQMRRYVGGSDRSILALQFSSNGRHLAMGGKKMVTLWDIEEGRAQFEVDSPWTAAVALSTNGETLATGSADGVRFFATATGVRTAMIRTKRAVSSLVYSSDGNLLAFGGTSGGLSVIDAHSGRKIWSTTLSQPWTIAQESVCCAIIGAGLLCLAFLRARSDTHAHSRHVAPSADIAAGPDPNA